MCIAASFFHYYVCVVAGLRHFSHELMCNPQTGWQSSSCGAVRQLSAKEDVYFLSCVLFSSLGISPILLLLCLLPCCCLSFLLINPDSDSGNKECLTLDRLKKVFKRGAVTMSDSSPAPAKMAERIRSLLHVLLPLPSAGFSVMCLLGLPLVSCRAGDKMSLLS